MKMKKNFSQIFLVIKARGLLQLEPKKMWTWPNWQSDRGWYTYLSRTWLESRSKWPLANTIKRAYSKMRMMTIPFLLWLIRNQIQRKILPAYKMKSKKRKKKKRL
jgi:hypothetical protein